MGDIGDIGILDPLGKHNNPLTDEPYSDNYRDLAKNWSKFPAYDRRQEILDALNRHQLIFIISGTGSGKTVLTPKYALHHTGYKGNIGVTLPKRDAARSSAAFAADTLDVTLGDQIGYLYKGSQKSMVSEKNKILYMTDGIMILKFKNDPLLSEYDVLIIDEAHERKIQIDLLLLFVKQLLLSGKRPDIRIVIMSATIDANKYQTYFKGIDSKIIDIQVEPNYDIQVHYLSNPIKSYMTAGLALIDKLIKNGVDEDMLFFITSSGEAYKLCNQLRNIHPQVFCIELYADLDPKYKELAKSDTLYQKLGKYTQKLVMSTNVAESSITIVGLKYVIDSCRELSVYYDPHRQAKIYDRILVSKAQATQRKGRVGRTSPGTCYFLLTEEEFNKLQEYPEPDIIKQDITMELLQLSRLNDDNIKLAKGVMDQLMDTPKKEYYTVASDLYKLYSLIDGHGKLTKLGMQVSQFTSLPLNRALFLIYAYDKRCAIEASIILTMIDQASGDITNLFLKDEPLCNGKCDSASKKALTSLADKKSDHLTYLNIFEEYQKQDDKKAWCNKHSVSYRKLLEVRKRFMNYFRRVSSIVNPKTDAQSRLDDYEPFSTNSEDILDNQARFMSNSHDNIGPIHQSRTENQDTKKRIIEALTQSHRHLTGKKLSTQYPKRTTSGTYARTSMLSLMDQPNNITKAKFIYDELVITPGSTDFQIVTVIKN